MQKVLSLVLLSTFFIINCSKKEEAKTIVATVNGTDISLDQFIALGSPLVYPPQKTFTTVEGRKALLDEVVRQEILVQSAMESKLLEKSDRLRRIIIQTYLDEKLGYEKYEPSQTQLKDYFEKNREEFEAIKARHILFKPSDVNDPKSWEETKKKAEMVLNKMKALGAKVDFAKFAKEYSDDQSNKEMGGDLPMFTRKQMVPDFSAAAFALKEVGEIGEVAKTPYGYHIIQLLVDQRSFELNLQAVKLKIGQGKRDERARVFTNELMAKSKVKIFDEALAKAQPK